MSTYDIKCEYCGSRIEADIKYIGYEFPCPACKQTFVLPLTGLTAGLVAGDFWLQKRAGSGDISEVFVGKRMSTNERVFIKVLSPLVTANREVAGHFVTEMCRTAKIEQPGLVKVLEVGEINGHLFLVTPHVEGECLDVIVKRDGPRPERDAVKLVLRAARVLRCLWDDKYLYIGVEVTDDKDGVHVLDAGNSKLLFRAAGLDLDRLNRTGTIADYLSPEQAQGDVPLDCRTDIYSLGATLFFLLTGSKPYAGTETTQVLQKHLTADVPDPQQRNPGLSTETTQLLGRMMAKDPAARFQSWVELVNELKNLLRAASPGTETEMALRTQLDLRAVDPQAGARPAPPRQPLPMPVILLGAVVLVMVIVLIVGWFVATRDTGTAKSPPPKRPDAPGKVVSQPDQPNAPLRPPVRPRPAAAGEDEVVLPNDVIGTKIAAIRRYLKKNPERYDFAAARLESFMKEAQSDGDRQRIQTEIDRVKKAQADAMSGAFGDKGKELEAAAQEPAPWFRDFCLLGPFSRQPDQTWNDIKPATPAGLPDLLSPVREGDRLLTWQRPVNNDDNVDFLRLLAEPHENVHVYALAEILADKKSDVEFDTAHDDGLTVWINSRQVFADNDCRASLTGRITLEKGRSILLLRVAQGTGGWNLRFRAVAPATNGKKPAGVTIQPVAGVKPTAKPLEQGQTTPPPAKPAP